MSAEVQEDGGELFKEERRRLSVAIRDRQADAAKPDGVTAAKLEEVTYGG